MTASDDDVIARLSAENPDLTELAKLQAMLKGLKQGVQTTPQTPALQTPQSLHFDRAYQCYRAGDLMGAIDLYSQAIDLDPNYVAAYYSNPK